MDADGFVARLMELGSPDVDVEKQRAQFRTDHDFIGARMGDVFALAKEHVAMPVAEIDRLFDSPIHEVRVGAVSLMGHQAVAKRTTADHLHDLYDLYLRRLDRIDTWDLVDVSAHKVVGGYLLDNPRDPLFDLARSPRWWERRVSIFSTLWFIRADQVDDSFRLAEILVDDEYDLMHNVVGGVLRSAGDKDRARLLAFLDEHAATMPRIALRFAIEHLDDDLRRHYRGLRGAQNGVQNGAQNTA